LNHPFVDGNKRIGHAALKTFLFLNGFELSAPVEDAERTFLALAAGKVAATT
jgi:death on curing protein